MIRDRPPASWAELKFLCNRVSNSSRAVGVSPRGAVRTFLQVDLTMAVRIRCIWTTRSCCAPNPPLLGRCISTSTIQRPPSRYHLPNLLAPRQKGANPDGSDNSRDVDMNTSNTSATRSLDIPWSINDEQNAVSENFRVNPVMINANKKVDRTEKWNAERWNNAHKSYQCRLPVVLLTVVSNRDETIQATYSFPLREGQLYTHKDLTFSAWEQRNKIRRAVVETNPDPFQTLNIDPFWEYKVLSRNLYTHICRITHSSRISYLQWDESSPQIKRVAPPKHNED